MNRAHRSLWILTALTLLATGIIAQALAAPAGTPADVTLAAGAILLAVSSTLLVRVVRFLFRTARPAVDLGNPTHGIDASVRTADDNSRGEGRAEGEGHDRDSKRSIRPACE